MQFSIGSTITGNKNYFYNWTPDSKTFIKSVVYSNNLIEFKDLVVLSELLSDQDILNIFPGKEYTSVFEQELGIKNTNKDKIYTDQEKSDYRIFGANNIKNEYILNFFKDLKILMVVENYMKLKIENDFDFYKKAFLFQNLHLVKIVKNHYLLFKERT
jgi:hypothetical protein